LGVLVAVEIATPSIEPSPILLSAVDGSTKRGTRLSQPSGVKSAQSVDEIGLRYDTEIVEAGSALFGHPIVGT
jgi:hypothetical protein